MQLLKNILQVTAIIFMLVVGLGIIVTINEHTNLFKPDRFYFNCEIKSEGIYAGFNLATMVVDVDAEKVLWRGLANNETKRELKHFTETEIKLSWKNAKKFDVAFTLNRLDGSFRVGVVEPKDEQLKSSVDKDYFKSHSGYCTESQQKY